jgi:hypothetical protein
MQEARKVDLRLGLRRKMSVELMNAGLKVCQFGTVGGYNVHPGIILARTAKSANLFNRSWGGGTQGFLFFVFVKIDFCGLQPRLTPCVQPRTWPIALNTQPFGTA